MSTEPEYRKLRIYPLPYIDFKLNANHIFTVQDICTRVLNSNPELPEYKVRTIQERALVSLAFADVYDKVNEFTKIPSDGFLYQKPYDYVHGNNKISLCVGRVNERLDETGPLVRFRVSTRVLNADQADWYVMAAIHMPHIHFIGWSVADDLRSSIKGYSASIFAGSDRIMQMAELPIEAKRVKGYFV